MSDPSIEVSLDALAVDISVVETAIEVQYAGRQGPAGAAGGSVSELFDSGTPPVSPPFPYLRFDRDIDGDVQEIILGTVD